MNNSYKEKIEFIMKNYELFTSIQYPLRFALFEYIFFNIDELSKENIDHMMKLYQLFDKKAIDNRIDNHKYPQFESRYINAYNWLCAYREHLEFLIHLDKDNKVKYSERYAIIDEIVEEYENLYGNDEELGEYISSGKKRNSK